MPPSSSARAGSTLTLWTPEDQEFWGTECQAIARLNLWIPAPALCLGFAVQDPTTRDPKTLLLASLCALRRARRASPLRRH
ncbi:hypothetical protein [Paracidovorax anthurii]|uniref:Uncharacterized protein n=1 Tax=Paracidovorax anthurii TaxID=78229 RepID=A0A328ZAU6_9BURK|nr:hypothetical protein [Paracidovorax anthurii]RAR83188.1 hypothetical protein AX018_101533 [Paracidovorax anthurii]